MRRPPETSSLLRVRNRDEEPAWPYKSFSRYLTNVRNEAGIRNDAQLARESDTYASLISRWRNGVHQPTRQQLNKVAKAVRRPPIELWIQAGIATAEELDVEEPDRGPQMPAPLRELIDNWAFGNEQQRAELMAKVDFVNEWFRLAYRDKPPERKRRTEPERRTDAERRTA